MRVLPTIILFLFGASGALVAGVPEMLAALSDNNAKLRMLAVPELAEAADAQPDEVLDGLRKIAMKGDPDARARVDATLKEIYKRQVLGIGQADMGWKLERFIWFGDDGVPCFTPIVMEIEKGSAAEKSGLKIGDVIWIVDGKPVPPEGSFEMLRRAMAKSGSGGSLKLTVEQRPKHQKDRRRVLDGKGRRDVGVKLGAARKEPIREFSDAQFRTWRGGVITRWRGSARTPPK